MNADSIRTICVVGAGTMGAQIAQQCALHGFKVWLHDADSSQLERALTANRGHLQRRVDKGRMDRNDMDVAFAAVETTGDLAAATDHADFVIEAVVEQLEVKKEVFLALEGCTSANTVLATNSSTIGISQIVPGLTDPSRCLNMHFFHPALVMKLVEVMQGPQTSIETVATTMGLAERIGKVPVLVKRELYGLLVNRILGAIKREAFWLAEEGYATPDDIDRAVKLGLNHPMGPFELSDFSGLDVFYYAALQRYRETGDERDKPPQILEDKVKAGHLGRKSGRGFYEYPEDPSH